MTCRRLLVRVAAYAWASPNTAIGLLAAALLVAAGGRARIVEGVLEVTPALDGAMASRQGGFDAITLGHVVLGRTASALSALRTHEQAHVRQCERWGPLFIPAYAASGAWQWLRGGRAHADNHFERQARSEGR